MHEVLENQGWTLAALLACAWLISLIVRWLAYRVRLSRHRTRQTVARRGETEAAALLERSGFEVVGAQVQGDWAVCVDDVPEHIKVFADYLVQRDGQLFVAEVKTGSVAPSVRTAATRRQLLEYLFVFQADGILLVDMAQREVRRVEFDFSRPPIAASPVL